MFFASFSLLSNAIRKQFFITPFILFFAGQPIFAQGSGVVKGRIFDRETGDGLPGANVVIQGTSIGAAADLEGEFSIRNAPAGEQTIQVSYLGYQTLTAQVNVPEDDVLEQDFRLTAQALEGETVIVTAQARGQNAAINQQITSNTISNIVSQARIQEIPDVNAAESIGRLPGVSIQRSGGEANKIAIRGLSPKYNTVTVNGVAVPATGGDDRSVDLSLISSSMLQGIELKKAITADMDADAFGGTVDLKLREAPDEPEYNATLQGGYNRLKNYYGNYNFNVSGSDRYFDGDFGAIGTFNMDNYNRSVDRFSSDYEEYNTGILNSRVANVILREQTILRNRLGGSLVLDYLIPGGKLTGSSFYNQLESDELYRINDINYQYKHHYFDMERRKGTTSIFTGAVGIKQDASWFSYDASFAKTESRSKNPEDFLWRFGREGNIFTVGVDEYTRPQDLQKTITVDSSMALNNIWVEATRRFEGVSTVQLNFKVPFTFGDQISGYVKTGGKLKWLNRYNDQEQNGRAGLQYGGSSSSLNGPFRQLDSLLQGWGLDTLANNSTGLPISAIIDNHRRDDFLENEYDLGLTFREDRITELTRALQQTRSVFGTAAAQYRYNSIGSLGRDYDGVERYQAAYLMAEFNLGTFLTFIPGVRYERDYSKYHGQRYIEVIDAWEDEAPLDFTRLENERRNEFWLPLIHLKIQPTDWLQLRLAHTKTITRPDYIQYAPITTLNGFKSNLRAANGLLRPAQSTNEDVSLSIFETYTGLITVSGFYKSIEDLILYNGFRLNADIPSTLLPEGTNVPEFWYRDPSNPITPWVDTYINNPNEAIYKGVELDWQSNFWYLPSLLKGIVINVNYTYIFSKTKYPSFYLTDSDSIKTPRPLEYFKTLRDTVREGRMPDQPAYIANITFGYDFMGFSARLSYLYQADVSTGIHATNPAFDSFSEEYSRLDLIVKQQLTNELELFANLSNLTNSVDRTYQRATTIEHPRFAEYYGLTMDFGIRVKL